MQRRRYKLTFCSSSPAGDVTIRESTQVQVTNTRHTDNVDILHTKKTSVKQSSVPVFVKETVSLTYSIRSLLENPKIGLGVYQLLGAGRMMKVRVKV